MEQEIDLKELDRLLDKAKGSVFIGKTAAFLGSLLCDMEFIWDSDAAMGTAATDGVFIWWCPKFFMNLVPKARETVLMHELWHPGLLHMIRRGNRDPKVWNYACDIRINNDLKNEGYSFEGLEWGWFLPEVDINGRMVEEDIYDYIIANNIVVPALPFGVPGDMCEPSEDTKRRVVASVVKATHNAKTANKQSTVPGILDDVITKFLTPVVPWEALLKEFFLDLGDWSYTWSKPNRRHTTMYLPARVEDDEGRLDHLMYFLDVSGSISQMDELRFSSEVKYIKEEFNPRKLTLVQFDTRIHEERVFLEDDPFEELVIMGRGGTCLRCVHDLIEKHNPTAAIIFTDMHVAPMLPLSTGTPIIYVAVGNGGHTPTFGKVIRIKR